MINTRHMIFDYCLNLIMILVLSESTLSVIWKHQSIIKRIFFSWSQLIWLSIHSHLWAISAIHAGSSSHHQSQKGLFNFFYCHSILSSSTDKRCLNIYKHEFFISEDDSRYNPATACIFHRLQVSTPESYRDFLCNSGSEMTWGSKSGFK